MCGTVGAVTLLLMAIGQLACLVPVRQMARLSPAETLRAEKRPG